MRVLLLNQYFHPDVAPTAQLATDLGEALARRGHEVCAVASNRPYASPSEARQWLPRRERHRGVDILRVPSTALGRRSNLLRVIDYATYFMGAAVPVLARLRPDVVVALSTPPLIAALGLLARELRQTRLVLWVMDVYPDLAVELGALSRGGVAARALGGLSRVALGRADAVVALDEAMRDRLVAGGAPAARVTEIDNWCDGDAIRPAPLAGNALRRELGLGDDEFTVSYSGNLGNGHDFTTVVDAMALLAAERVRWLVIGDGPQREALRRAVEERGLSARVIFAPYRPTSELPVSLSAAHASLVTLKAQLAGLLVPSKLYGLLAAGVPVVYVGPAAGRVHEVAGAGGAGVSIRNGDAPSLAAAIRRMRDQPDERSAMGRRGRALYDTRFSRARSIERHHRLLLDLTTNGDGATAATEPGEARRSGDAVEDAPC